jgi:hypothetical protein
MGIIDDLRTAKADDIAWMGRAPARIDFLQTIPGATFDVAWKRRVDIAFGPNVVHVIGREDLLNNKRARRAATGPSRCARDRTRGFCSEASL